MREKKNLLFAVLGGIAFLAAAAAGLILVLRRREHR